MTSIKTKIFYLTFFIFSMKPEDSVSVNDMTELVQELELLGYIYSKEISYIMSSVDRKDFVDPELVPNGYLYEDTPLDLGYGASISSPSRQAEILELLKDDLMGTNKTVLDIGSGSGYVAVCMALMLGDGGVVIGIDHIPELITAAYNNTKKSHEDLISSKKLKFILSDGRRGYPQGAPYDLIHVGANLREIPIKIIKQLTPNGKYIGPIGSDFDNSGQYLTVIKKGPGGKLVVSKLSQVYFNSLQDKETQLKNQFNSVAVPRPEPPMDPDTDF